MRFTYTPDHWSIFDGSDIMFVRSHAAGAFVGVNECGEEMVLADNEWSRDPATQWNNRLANAEQAVMDAAARYDELTR